MSNATPVLWICSICHLEWESEEEAEYCCSEPTKDEEDTFDEQNSDDE